MSIHNKERLVLSCPCCGRNFLSLRYWREHISKNHPQYIRQTSGNRDPRNLLSLPSLLKSTAPESPEACASATSEQPETHDNPGATCSRASDPVAACAVDSELDCTGVSDSGAANAICSSSEASTVNFSEFFETLVTEHGVSGRGCQEVAAFIRKACIQSATEARDNLESDICGLPSVVTASSYISQRRIASGSGSTLVKPISIQLGLGKGGVAYTFQYVPIIVLLQELFKHEALIKAHFGLPETLECSELSDFHTGSKHRDSLDKLQLIIYIDDFQVANPLGNKAKKSKLTGIYFALGYPKLRSRVKHIFVLALFRATYFKTYRTQILGHIVRELKELEEGGIAVRRDNRVLRLYSRVAFVTADNLGVHSIAGFTECFRGTQFICRYCHATTKDIQSKFSVADFKLRTKEEYDECLAKLKESGFSSRKCTEFGIKCPCELTALDRFHPVESFPPDISHDIFEGAAPKVISCVLGALIDEKVLTLGEINHSIVTFAYSGRDKTNKPQPLQVKGKKVIVRETAAECEILLNLLPLLIGSKIPENNKYWLVLLDFIRVVRWLSVWSISKDRLAEVQYITEEWLETFHAVFPTAPITPKFHYLLHYTAEIEKHGCPTYYKTLRFESKHQALKKFASNINLITSIYNIYINLITSNMELGT